MKTNRLPNRAKNVTVTEPDAAASARVEKIRRSMRGFSTRSSRQTNRASAARPTAASASVPVPVQPRLGASMMASTIATSAPPTSNVPTTSSDALRRLRPSRGRPRTRPPRAMATIGTFTRNTLPQEKCESSRPPSVGPMMTPTPATADQAAIACGRSRGGNTAFRIESVAGMTKAAPSPITTRSAISTPALGAKAAARLPSAYTHKSADERESPAVAVAERPGGDQQGSEAERVGVHDPLQGARAGVQHPRKGGQRRVEHRVVDDAGEKAEAENEQNLLAPGVALGPLSGCRRAPALVVLRRCPSRR